MHLNVKFAVIDPVITGTGRASGLPYKVQNVVIEWDEPTDDPAYVRTQRLQCKVHGIHVDRLQELHPVLHETIVPVEVGFTTSLRNNYVHNDISLWLS